ncbi:MAG: hypothetical protein ACLQMT_03200, partial [Candidatus Acidiferrales bacterium]
LPLIEAERQAVEDHTRRLRAGKNGQYFTEVVKVHPGDLIVHQYSVLIERSEEHANEMQNDVTRVNRCLGVGMNFCGNLVQRQESPKRLVVDLPHFEYVPELQPDGLKVTERDKYITAVRLPNGKLILWSGYHRTYALLRQLGGEGAGGAPLLTVMTAFPDAIRFFSKATPVRDTVLGERPALLRDFLDDTLSISVNLRKKRARARAEFVKPNRVWCGIDILDDDS